MEKKINRKIVIIYSLIHFIVDLSCCNLVINIVEPKMDSGITIFFALVIYNFFAFAMQYPIGMIADKVNKNAICSAIGCILVAISYIFTKFGLFACFIAGIGNAMFHVGGGIDVLNISDKKASLSGIFVSTGAMGIFLGSKFKFINFNKYFGFEIILFISAVLLCILYKQIKDKVKNDEMVVPKVNKVELISIICLMITVVIRGYVGLILSFSWKSNFALALISIFAVVFGKMLGGIIGDKIGFMKISMISLGISAVLYIFAFDNAICGILATLLFNMTMPITLTALTNMLIHNKGMAFGLLTVALFIGAIPVLIGYKNLLFSPAGLCIVTIVSMLALFVGLKEYNVVMEKKDVY